MVKSNIYSETTTTGMSQNLTEYYKGNANNLFPEDVAWGTWSGKRARENGFT